MVLAPSLPIQCKQIHEAPSVLSPVQIKSTGMRRRAGEGGGVHCHWHRVHNYSTALYLPLNPFCNKKKKKCLRHVGFGELTRLCLTCRSNLVPNRLNPARGITCPSPRCWPGGLNRLQTPLRPNQWVQWDLYIWRSLPPMGASV